MSIDYFPAWTRREQSSCNGLCYADQQLVGASGLCSLSDCRVHTADSPTAVLREGETRLRGVLSGGKVLQ
jgi:hypothetical protein